MTNVTHREINRKVLLSSCSELITPLSITGREFVERSSVRATTWDFPRAAPSTAFGAYDTRWDFLLIAKADGKTLVKRTIGPDTVKDGRANIAIDLSPFSGRTMKTELVNQPNGRSWKAAYWAKLDVLKN